MKRMIWISMMPLVTMVALVLYLGTPYLWPPSPLDVRQETRFEPTKPPTVDDALELIQAAQDALAQIRDYECIYLCEELLDPEKGNKKDKKLTGSHSLLKVRHEPFSVYMKFLGPNSKKGRDVGWISPSKQMQLRGVPLVRSVAMDGPLAKSESRHRISEVGLKNMVDQIATHWEKEKKAGTISIELRTAVLKVELPDAAYEIECICASTRHDQKQLPDGTQLLFQHTRVFFDKETGLPVRFEGYDWPDEGQDEGVLVERYTYLDIKTNVGLDDRTFRW
jgi:hypothetical protein